MSYVLYGDKGSGAFCVEAALAEAGAPYTFQTIALDKNEQTILEHFRLLQACDNLSLLTCVAYAAPAHLLHPLPLNSGGTTEVQVHPVAPRHFRLAPWPFAEPERSFTFPARHVEGKTFPASSHLEAAFHAAPIRSLTVTLSA